MELSLNTLVEQLDELFTQRGTRLWRIASGIQSDLPPIPELPEVSRTDAWLAVNELLSSPRVDEAKRARLVLLQRHLARAFVEARAAATTSAIQKFFDTHSFTAVARQWTPREALRELPRLTNRDARQALALELSGQLIMHASFAERQRDITLEGISLLRLEPQSFTDTLRGRPSAPGLATPQMMLGDTRDAHGDLAAYALKKLDPLLTLRSATEHDLDRASMAPWLFESFRKEDLNHALSRCLGDLGFSPNADGRITVDTEPRPGRDSSPRCIELRIPDQIRLLLTPDMGLATYSAWLSSWGIALHRANVGRTLPFVERRLGDRALIEAVGLVFESFLLDEGWHKRYLRMTASQAREAARAFAFRQLDDLRRSAALAHYSHEALSAGAAGRLSDDYVARLTSARNAEVLPGLAPFEVDAFGEHATRLDAWALAHLMRSHLLERFNEDYWRNPATGRWLRDLASHGQRDDALTIAKALGAESLSVAAAAAQRVAIMGA